MPTIIVASLQPREGRTVTTAGMGACLAEDGRAVHLLRLRTGDAADPAAEEDARILAAVPGCASPGSSVNEAEVQAQAADDAALTCLIEAPPGVPDQVAGRLSARVILVTGRVEERNVDDLAATAEALGDALIGVVVTRQPERSLASVQAVLAERGLTCLAALPEDRLLAGPTINEMAEALNASPLVESGNEDEAVEFVMVGSLSADPGQPYFLQHESKAVLNRFDRMDLHLGALATEPDCLILTGGGQPTPYLLDRVRGSDHAVTVLSSSDGTVRALEALDELYGRTRFSGRRKLARAREMFRQHLDLEQITKALS